MLPAKETPLVYKREEVGRKSKTARKRDEEGEEARRTGGGGLKEDSGDIGTGGTEREGGLPAFKTSRRGHGSSLASRRNCGTLRRRRKR